jgi:hypothetical protein
MKNGARIAKALLKTSGSQYYKGHGMMPCPTRSITITNRNPLIRLPCFNSPGLTVQLTIRRHRQEAGRTLASERPPQPAAKPSYSPLPPWACRSGRLNCCFDVVVLQLEHHTPPLIHSCFALIASDQLRAPLRSVEARSSAPGLVHLNTYYTMRTKNQPPTLERICDMNTRIDALCIHYPCRAMPRARAVQHSRWRCYACGASRPPA